MPRGTYILPENPTPSELRCLRIWLPNDPAFYAAFWASFEYLANWLAWERDTGHTALDAAASMRTAFETSRDYWLAGGCIYPIDPPYTETLPDGRTPTEGTIDDLLWLLWVFVVDIDERLADGNTVTDILGDKIPQWTARTGIPAVDELTKLVEAMADKTQAERDAVIDADIWEPIRDSVICDSDNVPISEPDLYDNWLDNTAELLFNVLNDAANWLFNALNDLAATLSGNAGAQGIDSIDGGGAGFGYSNVVCPWEHTFNLTIDNGGFVARYNTDNGAPEATYDGTNGWRHTCCNIPGLPTHYHVRLVMERVFADARITEVTANGTGTMGISNGPVNSGVRVQLNGGAWDYNPAWTPYYGGAWARQWIGDKICDKLQINIWADHQPSGCATPGSIYCTSITIKGKGTNPFI